mgnify:CR=1 FL=1
MKFEKKWLIQIINALFLFFDEATLLLISYPVISIHPDKNRQDTQ